MINTFKDLLVWQKSMDLTSSVYKITNSLPRDEQFGLTSQMRRASISIPSNIAEGQSRSVREFIQFLRVARGSRSELETQLLICVRLNYLTDSDIESALKILAEISKMTSSLIKNLALRA